VLNAAIDEVCRASFVERDLLLSESRARRVTHARRLLVGVLRLSRWSYPEIGRALGRDHTSIMHLHKTSELMELQVAKKIYDSLTENSNWQVCFNKSLDDDFGDICWLRNAETGEEFAMPESLEVDLVSFIRGLE